MDTFNSHISSLTLPVLCERIESMLDTSHNALISSLAISYILQEIDTSEDLLEDLECGANDSGLIDHIISNTHQTNHEWNTDSINNLHQIIVNAINGESMRSHSNSYSKSKSRSKSLGSPLLLSTSSSLITRIGEINWCHDEILHNSKYPQIENHPKIKNIRDLTVKQMGGWFNTLHETKSIVTLFAIARENNMINLFTNIFSIAAEYTFSHVIEHRNRMLPLGVIQKSLAFKNLHKDYINLLMDGMKKYQRGLTPLPMTYILGQKINDSLYDYLNYTYIFSEIVNELIMDGYNENLFQIDLWIIPKNIKTTLQIARDDSACSSDSESDDDIENGAEFEDKYILNIKQRLQDNKSGYKCWNNVNWTQSRFDEIMKRVKEEIKSMLSRNQLMHTVGPFDVIIRWYFRNCFRSTSSCEKQSVSMSMSKSVTMPIIPQEVIAIIWEYCQIKLEMNMNRIICIIDRRDWYYDIHVVSDGDIKTIEPNENKITSKNYDEVYAYNPPIEYCLFQGDDTMNLIEHSIKISRDYIFPKCIIRESDEDQTGHVMDNCYGLGYSFDGQAFAVSFSCLKQKYCFMNWFVNGWNLRISKAENIAKFWSQFFSDVEEDELQRIESDIISKWKLKLRDDIYTALENDILRFE